MMNENHAWNDDDLEGGLELQSFIENVPYATQQRRIVLTPPPEWLDPRKPLPTDREFHRWISEQLRARRNNLDCPRQRQIHNQSSMTDSDDASSCNSGNSRVSIVRKTIQRVSSKGLFGGIFQRRRGVCSLMEQQTFLLEDDCFAATSRESGIVGMQLSVIS
jgi:hypothetical protein